MSTLAAAATTYTSLTQTVQETIVQPVTTFVTTHTDIIYITDAAQFSLLEASETIESIEAAITHTQSASSASSASDTAAPTPPETSLSEDAYAGIAIGTVVLISIAAFFIFAFLRRRKRQRQYLSSHSDGDGDGDGKPLYGLSSKAELGATIATKSNLIHTKSRLHQTNESPPVELPTSQDPSLLYGGGTGAPTEPDGGQEEQVHTEKHSHRTETGVVENQTGAPSSPFTHSVSKNSSRRVKAAVSKENLHSLKAQERELAHKMEVSESLVRLRAEHAALVDRIRIAEMREKEVRGSV